MERHGQRSARARRVGIAVLAALAAIPVVGPLDAAAGKSRHKSKTVTVRDRASHFSIKVPRGFQLKVRKGVYVLQKGKQTMSFSRVTSELTPEQFGGQLLEQLGGTVVSRKASPQDFVAKVNREANRETVIVRDVGNVLAVTTSTSPAAHPAALKTVKRIARSARGGVTLQPPAPEPDPAPLALVDYRAPDGGATARVPQGWDISSTGGMVQGNGPDGAFILGHSVGVFLPEAAYPGLPSTIKVAPYANAADALTQVWPLFATGWVGTRITRVLRENVLPGFASSGLFLYEYTFNGRPFTGLALVATTPAESYAPGIGWNLYVSLIAVASDSDGRTGTALLDVWKSWNPSGAIAQRNAQQRQLIEESTQAMQDVTAFRLRQHERNQRDVGCLLLGYYDVQDNSRKYDLPPLPCGQTYTGGG